MQNKDLSIFHEQQPPSCEMNVDVSNCISLCRLATALRYYSLLDIIQNKQHQEILIHFMKEVYTQILDDYNHLLAFHNTQIQQINTYLIQQKQFKSCDSMNNCAYTSRHHQSSTNNNNKISTDPTLHFYKQTMDSLHFYCFHLFHSGLRVLSNDEIEQKESESNENESYFDAAFSRIKTEISQRYNATKTFDRFQSNSNSKFSIKFEGDDNANDTQDNDDYIEEEQTSLDKLYSFLKSNNISDTDIAKLNEFITQLEYDTESIFIDVEDIGNLQININNEELVNKIISFNKALNSSKSFSVGLRFYYWPYYKDVIELEVKSYAGLNDHSGYDVCDLYIGKNSAASSFKEEFFTNYKYLNIENYNNVMIKVNLYKNTHKVKSTKSFKHRCSPQHYDVPTGKILGEENLMSLILYTDFTKESARFSATFRKLDVFETLLSVKHRNSKYWWWAKTLRETVEIFGCSRGNSDDDHGGEDDGGKSGLFGPYFTGLSVVLNVPSFQIRLCSPTSTSCQITVALKFSGKAGMILQLNNPSIKSDRFRYALRGFNCSWISRYKAEDERLFCGGYAPIDIESVRIIDTDKNFGIFIKSLALLDGMINGAFVEFVDIKNINISLLYRLVEFVLHREKGDNKIQFDDYIIESFNIFRQNKQEIFLDYYNLSRLDNTKNTKMRDLIMNDFETHKGKEADTKYLREESDLSNVIKSDFFSIFSNVKTIRISTQVEWTISLLALLNVIKSTNVENVIIKVCASRPRDNPTTWLKRLKLSSAFPSIVKKYNDAGFDIDLRDTTASYCKGHVESYECTIARDA
eukprot:513035_1